ncbi:CzcE family metal-binding protein [Roseateles saccharophilus]|uniref:Heavy-metal resistance protein CzcE n=1 Tax=Roseateles saccharophilus TaxID=304 RepID=A0A4R3UVD0_ROSSA|nr:CzcE family metal-binding protein [Roseateles saccharophilus]TCU94663.1 heavy-metal resistance protein CzcE [Roseateles saccharophilus]
MKTFVQVAFAASIALANQAFAQVPNPYGSAASTAEAERTIEILPTTRFINVTRFETVRLAIKEGNEVKYVVWRFDTLSLQPFDLGTVVPSLAARSVKVYVARSHLDRN